MAGPFYFAWVDASERTFGVQHHVEDEQVFAFTVEQSECDFASLDIEIRNPRIGLLAPARKVWAWLSYDTGAGIVPLFFGRLVAVPDDMFLEVVKLSFTARPIDYVAQKQHLAASLRVPPYFDPIWLSEDARLNPDSVLESRPELWHTDRVTHLLTTSNILSGEDGVEEFLPSDVFYDGVSARLNGSPVRTVDMVATVGWTQHVEGRVDVLGGTMISTYTGDGLISDWPKPGTALKGGWTVFDAFAQDVLGVERIPEHNTSFTSTVNNENATGAGATTSATVSSSTSGTPPPVNSIIIPGPHTQSGSVSIDEATGNTSSTSMQWSQASVSIPIWAIRTRLICDYKADRKRTERIHFTLSSDLQAVVTEAGEDEAISLAISSADLSTPLGDGQTVLIATLAQGIYTLGDTLPADGSTVTIDGVVYTFQTVLTEVAGHVLIGANTYETITALVAAIQGFGFGTGSVHNYANATVAHPTVQVSVLDGNGMTVRARASGPDGNAIVTAQSGTNGSWLSTYVSDGLQPDDGASLTIDGKTYTFQVALTNVDGNIHIAATAQLTLDRLVDAINDGATGAQPDPGLFFANATVPHPTVTAVRINNVVTLTPRVAGHSFTTSVSGLTHGTVGGNTLSGGEDVSPLPIGDTGASIFFPTDRGRQALEYLIALARNHLLLRARVVEIGWDCTFQRALGLSCRKNAIVHDPRLPGGQASGKIISYRFGADGGKLTGSAIMACAPGYGGSVTETAGEPTYVDDGFVDDGYQLETGGTVAMLAGDISYSLPTFVLDDSMYTFLGSVNHAAVVRSNILMDADLQRPRIVAAATSFNPVIPNFGIASPASDAANAGLEAALGSAKEALKNNPTVLDLLLARVEGGPFESIYEIELSRLTIPAMINLEAAA